MREQEAVERQEPVRVVLGIETFDLDDVPFIFVTGVAEGDLIFEDLPPDELHRFEVRVKLVDDRERLLQQVL
jgi:hypothetical protein